MPALKRPLALVTAAVVLVFGFDLATYAATGDSLIIGKSNTTNKATKLKRTTSGAVLQLNAKKNSPPLAVNSDGRVKNLNADQVDGLTSEELLTRATTVRLGLGADKVDPSWNVSLPDGTYLVNWQAYVDMDDPVGDATCGFAVGTDFLAPGSLVPNTLLDLTSGSGVVTFSAATTETFFCNTSADEMEAFIGSEGIDLTFVKLEGGNTIIDVPAN